MARLALQVLVLQVLVLQVLALQVLVLPVLGLVKVLEPAQPREPPLDAGQRSRGKLPKYVAVDRSTWSVGRQDVYVDTYDTHTIYTDGPRTGLPRFQ
jgi:hypothetical protein